MPDFILGAAQLGMEYGIANALGKPDVDQALVIVETAWECGIRRFDTAQSYGNSETVLGRSLRRLGVLGEARIATKLPASLDPADLNAVEASIQQSFDCLGTDRLWCMMLHRAAFLDAWDQGLGGLLTCHRAAGRFERLGVSFNSPGEAVQRWNHPAMEVLQVACNAWDRRMIRLGILKSARDAGKVCCARSIYLQGLLTMAPADVARRLPIAHEAATRWRDLAGKLGLRPKTLAVRFAAGLDVPLVIGAESPHQVAETVALASEGPLPPSALEAIAATLDPVLDDTILTPSLWEQIHR